MIRDTIHQMVAAAAAALHERGDLELPEDGLPEFDVERPQRVEHGDYATNLAMKLARPPKARVIAQQIADYLNETVELVPAYALIEKVEIAGPGFINLRLRPAWLLQQAQTIINAGVNVGAITIGNGTRVNLEFVSANPTGPVHIGNGRGGFIGDTIGNVLRAAGYDVTKEYYFNDYGQQINKLGRSIEWYMRKLLGQNDATKPEEGYFDREDDPEDTYYQGVARRILEDSSTGAALLDAPEDGRERVIGHAAAQFIINDIKHTMDSLNIKFDVWFNEASLGVSGELQQGLDTLRKGGYLYEKDGATFMETTRFGDDKDRVIIKADGTTTYIASDVAYASNKLNRGFDRLIYVLGPDHHGYIARLKATAMMLGYSADRVHVLLYQQVNLKVDGVSQRMSKRRGTLVTLDELVGLVGVDVTRFFYLMRDANTHLDFDLALAMREGDDNPGLTVQYGHARTAGVLRKAAEVGLNPEIEAKGADMSALLGDTLEQIQAELTLMRELARLEEIIERSSINLEPHHLTKYGMDIAAAFHAFYDRCPMLRADSPEIRAARFALTLAARTTLARVLSLLGMSAPERMDRAEV
jgi:arginyl-tRNA synthetase